MSEKPFEVVLATSNPGKVQELQAMLEPLNWRVLPQSNWSFDDAEETAVTFVENALLKARHAAAQTGLAAIADDSGLAVDALDGEPGVYSARYAGANANDSDSDNLNKLLSAMRDVPAPQRQAQFHCVLVYIRHANDPTPIICHGRWHGLIHDQAQGSQGFGYDPIFWLPEQQCTAAQLSREQKQQLSHRGQALGQLLPQLTARPC